MNFITRLPKQIVISLIDLYQRTLSPDHSWLKSRFPHGYCRFYPSCSQYTREAVGRFGAVKGLWLGARRIAKCNPFIQPRVDMVPHQ